MEQLPVYIPIVFLCTVLLSIVGFYAAVKSRAILIALVLWTLLQAGLGLSGLYQDTLSVPPRLMLLGVFPTIAMMLVAFFTTKGRAMIDTIDLRTLTYVHAIRIPVELVLLWLFHQGVVSVYMTFEGTNFDLFSGITAPLVAYFAFRGASTHKPLLLAWNVVCFLLLLNVVITAVFAIPSPFQKIAFDQPNIAVLYFPFNLLPTVVVPMVLFAHLVAFRRLLGLGK